MEAFDAASLGLDDDEAKKNATQITEQVIN